MLEISGVGELPEVETRLSALWEKSILHCLFLFRISWNDLPSNGDFPVSL